MPPSIVTYLHQAPILATFCTHLNLYHILGDGQYTPLLDRKLKAENVTNRIFLKRFKPVHFIGTVDIK